MGTKPLSPSQLKAALVRWNVPTNYVSGWETRDNGGHWVIGSVADDVEGFMAHHTGDDASDSITRALLIKGRSDLSGPLCNFGITDTGKVDLIAAGSANHAGKGDPDTLAKVQSGDYTGNIYPDQHSSSTGSVPGNGRFYGAETYYGGGDDKTVNALQYRVLILVGAAVLDALARASGNPKYRSGKRFIGHKEWTDWKPDPAGITMSAARADVQWCLDHGPTAARHWYDTGSRTAPAPTPAPTPTTKEPSMVLVKFADADEVYASDGIHRRHVSSSTHLAALQRAIKDQGGTGTVTVVKTAGELDAFGPIYPLAVQ